MKHSKSEWTGVSCQTQSHKDAIKSWFGGFADSMTGPIKANILKRLADDKTLKVRAIFINEKGVEIEIVRTMNKTYTIDISPQISKNWI